MFIRTLILLHLFIVTLLLMGCPQIPTRPTDEGIQVLDPAQRAKQLDLAGNYAEAAQEYLRLAEQSFSPTKQGYQLSAAESLVKANKTEQAKIELARIDFDKGVSLQIPRELVYARIDLVENRAHEAARRLNGIANANMLPVPWRIKYFDLHAQVLEAQGDTLGAVRERVDLDNLLRAESLPTAVNHQTIWRMLNTLPADALKQTPTGNDNYSGWLNLVILAKTVKPRHFNQSVENWKIRFPNHPATQDVLSELIQSTEQAQKSGGTTSSVKEIALLLPLSGKFGEHAKAVKDGFLAANKQDQASKSGDAPNVTPHDVDTKDIVKKYQELVQQGVDIIVGPLDKEALGELVQSQSQFPVPTLGLNYLDLSTRPANLYQFGLAPEDEVVEIATRAWADGRRVAAAFLPEGNWGQRVLRAFQTAWEKLGGRLGKVQTYGKDTITAVKQLTQNLEDADMVFFVAFPEGARKARPYLKYNAATHLPIYSTSHIYENGSPMPEDRDLDEVMFVDIPWIIAPDAQAAQLKANLKQWPVSTAKNRRLYALGIDAYQVLAELPRLATQPTEKWQGQTGLLSLDNAGMIHRQLRWARFVNGVPQLLNESTSPPLANDNNQ